MRQDSPDGTGDEPRQPDSSTDDQPPAVPTPPTPSTSAPDKPPPLTLAGRGPGERLNDGKALAAIARTFIQENDLFTTIIYNKGKPKEKTSTHVNFEGWTFVGAAAGDTLGDAVFAIPVWTRRMTKDVHGLEGWEARVEARTSQGVLVGAADGECTREEDRWRGSPDFQVRSMAQTRAASKALRIPLGWIMRLAGFDATPAEEMEQAGNGERPARRQATGRPQRKAPAPAARSDDAKAKDEIAGQVTAQWPAWVEQAGLQFTIATALRLPTAARGAFKRYWLENGGTYGQAKTALAEIKRLAGEDATDAATLEAIGQVDAYGKLMDGKESADEAGQTAMPV